MADLKKIYTRPNQLLVRELKKELRNQGHYNTGALDASFASTITQEGDNVHLEGTIFEYGQILSDGTRPEKASMAQFYFLKEFFISKGVDDKKAGGYAAATIHVWMKEGMSTKKSLRFSKNGRRRNFIGLVDDVIGEQITSLIFAEVDTIIQKEYSKTKSETI